jgi:hypothetical protein
MKKRSQKLSPLDVRERRSLLALHGITTTEIARRIGRARSTVSTVINYYPRKRSKRIQEQIARLLLVNYESLWGGSSKHATTLTSEKQLCK